MWDGTTGYDWMSEVGHGSRRFTCEVEKNEQRVFRLWDRMGQNGTRLALRMTIVFCRSIAFMGQDIHTME